VDWPTAPVPPWPTPPRRSHSQEPLRADARLATPPVPLGEAPCSVNCHVTIAGRQVQLTLRGTDEGDVLARLETLLARYPVPQAQPEAPRSPQTPQPEEKRYCPRHGSAMTLNHKEGRSWWSHRGPDGAWCKGR